jgi:hypothetical protein
MFAANIRICIYGIHVFDYHIVNNANCTLYIPYVNKLTIGCGHSGLKEKNQNGTSVSIFMVECLYKRFPTRKGQMSGCV